MISMAGNIHQVDRASVVNALGVPLSQRRAGSFEAQLFQGRADYPYRCCDPVSRETEDSMHASVVNRWEVDMRQRNCSPAVGGD